MFERVRDFGRKSFHTWERYEHYFGMAGIIAGFSFDLFVAKRPDSVFDNMLLLSHLLMAGGIIVALNIHSVRRKEEHQVEPFILLIALQFLFGGLSSNLLVLYGHSGTFTTSALFLGLLLIMLIGNEFLKSRYAHLRFNIAVYYVLVFTYLVISVPTFVLHQVGVWVFLASGAISLAYIALFLWAVYRFILRGRYRLRQLAEVGVYIAGIYFAFNLFYFLNIIPPVPLALRDVGIYHSITRTGGGYDATYEEPWWFAFWRSTSPTYHLSGDNAAYCFSSVFAPTGLSTPIAHSWEYYNESAGTWEIRTRVTFPISGGQSGGYRGYSQKILTPGKWRCDVETASGQLIGRFSFTAAPGQAPALSERTL